MINTKISKPTLVNIVLLGGFTIYFLVPPNFEFLIYAVTLSAVIYLIERTDRVFGYGLPAKIGFSTWLFLHLGGGAFHINGGRWYDTILIDIVGEPYNILRYDQALHTFCYFVITLFIYAVVRHIGKEKANRLVICLITALAAMGVSATNEIIEFSAVVFFNSDGVGGYYNNALDLVFNLTGVIPAIAVAARVRK